MKGKQCFRQTRTTGKDQLFLGRFQPCRHLTVNRMWIRTKMLINSVGPSEQSLYCLNLSVLFVWILGALHITKHHVFPTKHYDGQNTSFKFIKFSVSFHQALWYLLSGIVWVSVILSVRFPNVKYLLKKYQNESEDFTVKKYEFFYLIAL